MYRGPLEHELWSRYGWGFDEVVTGVRAWNLVALLVAQIAKDTYSHLYAAFRGWGYAPNPMDAFFLDWVDAQAVMHHRSNQPMPRPLKRPWETGEKRAVPAPDPSRMERRKALQERLGLGRVVEADDEPDGQPESEGDE